MKCILVTGGAGFIGSHTTLCLLENGFDVIVVDSLFNSYEESINRVRKIYKSKNKFSTNNLFFFKVDLCNLKKFEYVFKKAISLGLKIEGVIHLAGYKSVPESIKFPTKYWFNNVRSTLNLIFLLKKYECDALVFSSSASVYGNNTISPLNEKSETNPINPYGKTKLYIEDLLKKELDSKQKGLSIISLRYFNPIGAHHSGHIGESPRENSSNIFPLMCQIANQKNKVMNIYGGDWLTRDGSCIRDYIHVMDLSEAHVIALNYIINKKTRYINLNIGTGIGTSVLELIKIFEIVNKVKFNITFKPKREGDVPTLIADNSLSKKILNWFPKRSIEDMCRDSWNWQQKNPFGFNSQKDSKKKKFSTE